MAPGSLGGSFTPGRHRASLESRVPPVLPGCFPAQVLIRDMVRPGTGSDRQTRGPRFCRRSWRSQRTPGCNKKASAGCKKYQPRDIAVTEASSVGLLIGGVRVHRRRELRSHAREPMAAPERHSSEQQKKRTHNQRAYNWITSGSSESSQALSADAMGQESHSNCLRRQPKLLESVPHLARTHRLLSAVRSHARQLAPR